MPETRTTNIGGRLSEEKVPAGGGAWRLLLFMAFVLGVFLLSYLGLVFGYKAYVKAQIEKRDQEIDSLAAQVPKEEQDEFLKFQFQLANLQNILNKHVVVSKLLPLIEANTNSQVFYTSLDVNTFESRVDLEATAVSFDVVAQQLSAYQRLPEVLRYQMTNARKIEGGRVSFDLTLFLSPKVFKLL